MKQNFDFKKIFLITMVISLSISALIGIFVFLLGDFGETDFKLLMTTLTIGGYSLTGLCCSVLYEKRKCCNDERCDWRDTCNGEFVKKFLPI